MRKSQIHVLTNSDPGKMKIKNFPEEGWGVFITLIGTLIGTLAGLQTLVIALSLAAPA